MNKIQYYICYMPIPCNMRGACKIVLILCLFFSQAISAQSVKKNSTSKIEKRITGKFLLDSILRSGHSLNPKGVRSPQINSVITSGCNTSTFYMHLPALEGEGIELKAIQTLPEGNFVAVCNNILSNNEKAATIVKISNGGSLLKQQQILINNKMVVVYDMKVMIDGSIVIAGSENENPDNVFIIKLNSDLSTNWVKVFTMPATPVNVKVDLAGDDAGEGLQQILLAVQLNSSVVCVKLKADNSVQWSSVFDIAGINELVGFSNVYTTLGLIVNVTRNGMQFTSVTEINGNDGSWLKSGLIGDGGDETKCFELKSYYRLNLVSVRKSGNTFKLERDKIYSSSLIETQHLYTVTGSIDFNISGAMDNSSDALGFCLPKDGKLIFIRHFSEYYTSPDFTREYNVPVDAVIKGIARSYDGGYLFALNTSAAKEIILIKTDSIGVLSGCNYATIQNNYNEALNLKNSNENVSTSQATLPLSNANITFSNNEYKANFDCNQNYCPAPPAEDSCLNTYFKILNSNSYIDLFSEYFLMKSNNQLALTSRYDRVTQGGNIVSAGLKLYDDKSNFLKGVNLFSDTISFSHVVRKVDDEHILIRSYSSGFNEPHFTFTLVTNNLDVVWQKSVDFISQYAFGGDPNTEDWYKDENGNYYYVATNPGFFSKPKIFIYKMDKNGNKVWVKGYEFEKGYFKTVKITSTGSSLIIIVDGFNNGSVSARIDKQTGSLINSYNFNNEFSGSLYERVLKSDGNIIFYSGSTENEDLIIGSFDTTGKPIKLKKFKDYNTIPRAGNVKNGKMYLTFDAYNNGHYNDVIVRIDSALNVEYMHEYDNGNYILASGMGIDDNGTVFVGGNWFYNYYANPFIKKYDNNGLLGTCSYVETAPVLLDVDPQTKLISATGFTVDVMPTNIGFDLLPDDNGHKTGNILCSSTVQCNSIKVAGPDIICQLNAAYTYKAQKNLGCTLAPLWMYDTTFITPKAITDTAIILNFIKAGQTWLKAKLNTGCGYYIDSMLIQIQNVPTNFTLGNDTVLCASDSIVLKAGAGFNNYQWQNGATDSFFMARFPGIYFVQTANLCGDKYADTIKITEAILPALSLGNDTTLCKNDTITLNASPLFRTYNWQPQSLIIGQGATVYSTPVQSQQFILNATTNDGCKTADSISVNVINPRPVYLGNDTSFCDYDSITLNAGSGYLSYQWNTGNISPFITIHTEGSYIVSAQDANKCFARDTVMVTISRHPSFDLGADVSLCTGKNLNLDPGVYKSYLWYDGTINQTHFVNQPGNYFVTVTDNNNCVGRDSISILSMLPLPADFLNTTDSLCQYDKLQIQPLQNFVTYNWSTGSTQPFIVTETAGVFTLTVKDINGCEGSDTIHVISKNCMYGVYIPNAFTPNADQRNDVFRAKVFGTAVSFRMQVYNRFGQLLFSTNDPYKGWDGTFNGKIANPGTYVWQCVYQLEGDKVTSQKGTVILIR